MQRVPATVEEQLILKAINEECPWENLPKKLQATLSSKEEWHRRRLQWNNCFARKVCRESEYYEEMTRYLRKNLAAWWLRWDIILSTITLVAESTSAALEQTSPYKLKAAEYGLFLAIVSAILLFSDLVYKYSRHRNVNKDNPCHQLSGSWEFADSFGSLTSVLALISAFLHYHYQSSYKEQPIRFSMLALAFSMCVFCSRIFRRPEIHKKPVFVMMCRHLGAMTLEIASGGDGTSGCTEFGCSICSSTVMHPTGV